MPRTSNDTPERNEEGRFTSPSQGAQARNRDEDDDTRSSRGQSTGGQGRGWFGDSEGHAEAGSHSHDNTRSRSYDDDDRRGGNRYRDEEGQFAGSSRGGSSDDHDEADFGAWHAYGHARGYHGYQRRGNQASGNRGPSSAEGRGWFGDSEGHAEAGSHSHDNTRGTSRSRSYDDSDDRRGGNRQRDDEGRFAGNNRH